MSKQHHKHRFSDLCDDLDDSQSQPDKSFSSVSTAAKKKVLKRTDQVKTTDSEYVEGSIIRIKLSKFLTYDNVELKPGPHLNVVIGPNGTGKSALVCAICLGLAGKTSWLGRATDPRDYIRHGSDKAEIELELYNPQADASNYLIRREISRTKSNWWLNNRSTTQKNVEETVAALNIQVGNLCQFLPQEKVADFARMSQQELLENTEKSVGEAGMYEKHQKLKGAREEARRLEGGVHRMVEVLDQEKQRNTRLEQDVKCYHERKKFLEKVEVLKMKKPWLEYTHLKEKFEQAKTQRDVKSNELKQASRHLAPLEKQTEKLRAERAKFEPESKAKIDKIRMKTQLVNTHKERIVSLTDKAEDAKAEFDAKVKDEETRKKRLNDLKDQLHALEDGLAQMDSVDAQRIQAGLEKVSGQMREFSLKMSTVMSDGEGLAREIKNLKAEIRASEGMLRQIRDVSNRRLEVLRSLHQHTYDAVLWLRANKDRFRKTIHEPMIVCLNVTRPEHAKVVEAHISFNDLRAFVCEDPEDLQDFMRIIKTEQGLRVNAVRAPQQPADSFKPKFPISRYTRYGFENYLQSLFTCPEPVMSYLCTMYKVHFIPAGTQEVVNQAERIQEECPELTNFYSQDSQYSIRRSRYTKNVSSRNMALKQPRALVDSINVDKEHKLTETIQVNTGTQREKEQQYKELQKKSEELERTINQLREEKRSLMKEKDQRKNLEHQITTKQQRIRQVASETMDIEAEERQLQVQLRKIVSDKCVQVESMQQACGAGLVLAKERVCLNLRLDQVAAAYSAVETQLRNGRQRLETLEREVEDMKEHVQELKQQAREKNLEAKRAAGIDAMESLETQLRDRGVWEDFTNAPSQLDELEGQIHSMQARAEAMFEVDEAVVRDFEKRAEKIKELEQTLAREESRQTGHQDTVSRLREAWLSPLLSLIGRINENFSYFFSSLQCCGEVSLNVPENPEDYEKYGVSIKVKFRDNENLRELTATHQSGGERSVSTVLYMMALQELTRCPFRCVDEINQGMDPKNERKIFQLVVQTVCQRNTSQYFLLTPKLLPDLEFSENMTVLCVYNGPHMMGHKEWNLTKFIHKGASLAA